MNFDVCHDLVLERSAQGEAALKKDYASLTPKQRVTLRLADGEKTVEDILLFIGKERVVDNWLELIENGYLQPKEMNSPLFDDYSMLQRKLATVVICRLNQNASVTFKIISNIKETPEGISEALHKIERLVRMTIDENIADQLSLRMREVVG